jgi:hypothetical protein
VLVHNLGDGLPVTSFYTHNGLSVWERALDREAYTLARIDKQAVPSAGAWTRPGHKASDASLHNSQLTTVK